MSVAEASLDRWWRRSSSRNSHLVLGFTHFPQLTLIRARYAKGTRSLTFPIGISPCRRRDAFCSIHVPHALSLFYPPRSPRPFLRPFLVSLYPARRFSERCLIL